MKRFSDTPKHGEQHIKIPSGCAIIKQKPKKRALLIETGWNGLKQTNLTTKPTKSIQRLYGM